MKTLLADIKTSFLAMLVMLVVLCGVYPLAVWGVGRALFAERADGSLHQDASGTLRGSRLLGQSFTAAKYFHSRPSAAGAGYDAANSSGSNLGPTSQKLAEAIKADVATYRAVNGLSAEVPVPADAVTRSASGLDPHISVANAKLQANRVAKARSLPLQKVLELVEAHTEGPFLGVLGDAGLNVLRINLALDGLEKGGTE